MLREPRRIGYAPLSQTNTIHYHDKQDDTDILCTTKITIIIIIIIIVIIDKKTKTTTTTINTIQSQPAVRGSAGEQSNDRNPRSDDRVIREHVNAGDPRQDRSERPPTSSRSSMTPR